MKINIKPFRFWKLRSRLHARLYRQFVPVGQRQPWWLLMIRFLLMPLNTIKYFILGNYLDYDILTDTYTFDGVKFSGVFISDMVAQRREELRLLTIQTGKGFFLDVK